MPYREVMLMADQIDMLIQDSVRRYVKENSAKLADLFKRASRYLAKCINKKIIKIHNYDSEQFFDEFGNLSGSDFLSKISMSQNGYNIEITYVNELANVIRPSIFYYDNHKKANVFWLINDGYSVKKNVWFRNIVNFGQRVGQHFVEKGIADFNSTNPYGMKVDPKRDVVRPMFYFG